MHVILFAIVHFIQIVIPTNFNDIIPWLVTPAILGAIASYIIGVIGAPKPDPKNPGGTLPGWTDNQKLLAKFIIYLIIAVLDIALQVIPPSIIAEFAMPITIILGVIASFFGQMALHLGNGIVNGFIQGWRVLKLIGYRAALGRAAVQDMFTKEGFTLLPKG